MDGIAPRNRLYLLCNMKNNPLAFLLPALLLAAFTHISAQPALEWERKVMLDANNSRSVQISSLFTHGDTCLMAFNYTDAKTGEWQPNLFVYSDRTKYNTNYSGFFKPYPGYQVAAVAPMHAGKRLEDFFVMLNKQTHRDSVSNILLCFKEGKLEMSSNILLGGYRGFNTTSMRYDSAAQNLVICLKDIHAATGYICTYNRQSGKFSYGQMKNISDVEVQAFDGPLYVVSSMLNSDKRDRYFDNNFAAKSMKNILRYDAAGGQVRSYRWFLDAYSRSSSPWEFDTFRIVKTIPWKYDMMSVASAMLPGNAAWIAKVIYPEKGDRIMARNVMRYFTEDNENRNYTVNEEIYARNSIQFYTRGPITDFTPINQEGTRFLCVVRPMSVWKNPPGTLELCMYATNKLNVGTRVLSGYLGARSDYSFATSFDRDTTYLLAYTENSFNNNTPGIVLSKWYIPDSCKAQFPEALTKGMKMYLKEFITDERDYDGKGYRIYNKYASLKIIDIDPSDPAYEHRKKIIGKKIDEGFFKNIVYSSPAERKVSYWVSGTFKIKGTEYTLQKALILRDLN
jgi:hypothetical protein